LHRGTDRDVLRHLSEKTHPDGRAPDTLQEAQVEDASMSGSGGIKSNFPSTLAPLGLIEPERPATSTTAATTTGAPATAKAEAPDVRGLVGSREDARVRLGQGALPTVLAAATQTAATRGVKNDVADPEFSALLDMLIATGRLKGPAKDVTQGAFEQAIRGAIGQAIEASGPDGQTPLPSDLEELMALVDSVLQKEAHRRNGDRSRFQSDGNAAGRFAESSVYSPRSTGGARATEPMVPINPNAPAPGRINEAIAASAQAYRGTSTRGGPDGGNLACAWSVNNILRQAGIRQLGNNPNAVASARAALEGGRGVRIDPKDVRAGDIVIWPPPRSHIGIAGGNGVLHNSSSRAAFVNNTAIPPGASIYRVTN
jgi:hypothetical protein